MYHININENTPLLTIKKGVSIMKILLKGKFKIIPIP